MAHDFPFERGQTFGDWLHSAMHEALTFEDAQWAVERIDRIEERLQGGRAADQRFSIEVPWMEEPTAFTGPGHYIYITRRLFEQCATDEMAAFIVAHEMAHHDLGHVALFRGWADKIVRLPGATLFALFFFALEKRLYGPEKECEADRYGLGLCLAAGYAAKKCLEIFDIMEHLALDRGDLDMVYGPDVESDDELDENASWTTKAQIWAWQRRRGYLPIRDRRQMLLKHLSGHA